MFKIVCDSARSSPKCFTKDRVFRLRSFFVLEGNLECIWFFRSPLRYSSGLCSGLQEGKLPKQYRIFSRLDTKLLSSPRTKALPKSKSVIVEFTRTENTWRRASDDHPWRHVPHYSRTSANHRTRPHRDPGPHKHIGRHPGGLADTYRCGHQRVRTPRIIMTCRTQIAVLTDRCTGPKTHRIDAVAIDLVPQATAVLHNEVPGSPHPGRLVHTHPCANVCPEATQ